MTRNKFIQLLEGTEHWLIKQLILHENENYKKCFFFFFSYPYRSHSKTEAYSALILSPHFLHFFAYKWWLPAAGSTFKRSCRTEMRAVFQCSHNKKMSSCVTNSARIKMKKAMDEDREKHLKFSWIRQPLWLKYSSGENKITFHGIITRSNHKETSLHHRVWNTAEILCIT